MVQTKKIAFLWLMAGLLCAILLSLVVLTGLCGQIMITDRDGIQKAADSVMHYIRSGNWEALEKIVLGSPSLRPLTGEADSAEALIWDAYRDSLNWTYRDRFEVDQSCISQKITVSCLDIPKVTSDMAAVLQTTSKADPAQQAAALQASAQKVLETNAQLTECEITLTFRREKGQWLLVPNGALQALLSGFTIH